MCCRAIPRTSFSNSPGFVSPSVRTMTWRRGDGEAEIARAASSRAGYMTVPPPGWRVARSVTIFCVSPASVRARSTPSRHRRQGAPPCRTGSASSMEERAADFTTSSLVSPVGTVAPMLPDLSTTMHEGKTGDLHLGLHVHVHGQCPLDRRLVVAPGAEACIASHHEKPAARVAHVARDGLHLLVGDPEAGDIVQDQGVVGQVTGKGAGEGSRTGSSPRRSPGTGARTGGRGIVPRARHVEDLRRACDLHETGGSGCSAWWRPTAPPPARPRHGDPARERAAELHRVFPRPEDNLPLRHRLAVAEEGDPARRVAAAAHHDGDLVRLSLPHARGRADVLHGNLASGAGAAAPPASTGRCARQRPWAIPAACAALPRFSLPSVSSTIPAGHRAEDWARANWMAPPMSVAPSVQVLASRGGGRDPGVELLHFRVCPEAHQGRGVLPMEPGADRLDGLHRAFALILPMLRDSSSRNTTRAGPKGERRPGRPARGPAAPRLRSAEMRNALRLDTDSLPPVRRATRSVR